MSLLALWPKSTFWRVALVAFWIASALGGALSSPRYVEICKSSAHSDQKECAPEQVAYVALRQIAVIANYASPAINALATVLIMLFTFGLYVATKRLWGVADSQIALARDEFISTHRPKIIVHTFEHSTDDQERLGVLFTYVNAGATPAKVTEIASKIVTVSGDPRPGISLDATTMEKWLAGGETATRLVESEITENAAVIQDMRTQRGFDAPQILCIGHIRYTDSEGRPRQTGFCRRYDAATRTWQRVENSDYEYAY